MRGAGPAAASVFAFGVYMIGEGLALMIVPGALLGAVGVPTPTDAWVRVVGWCLVVLGLYYVQCARHGLRPFFRWSAAVRIAQLGFFVALWGTGKIQPVLVGFSLVEAASGLWTWLALREERRVAGQVAR